VAPLLRVLDRIMQISILMVAPIVIGLLIADIALGFLSRMTPQFHVFDLSLAVKNLLFTFLMAVYMVFLMPVMLSQIGALNDAFDLLRRLVEGGAH
jgi:type III secretion protein T